MRVFRIAVLLCVGLIAGCGGGGANNQATLKLESEIQFLKDKVGALDGQIQVLKSQQIATLVERLSLPQAWAEFDPQDQKKYTAIQAPAGVVLAVLEKVEPYLDGFTVSMRIGNPTTASYTGVKGKVRWGRQIDVKQDEKYNKLSEKEIDLTDSIPSGRWTIVNFNIAPAKSDEVRRIVFEPVFNSLRLAGG